MESKNYNKGIKKANMYIGKVTKRIKEKGYYENAGAKEEIELTDFISGLDLTYKE